MKTMFTILKALITTALTLAIIGVVIYFLPHEMKLKAIGAIAKITPESLEGVTEDLLLTPPEEREKLIGKLEQKLDDLKDASQTEAAQIIESSKNLIGELKAKSDELSLAEMVKEKIAENIFGKTGTTTCAEPL